MKRSSHAFLLVSLMSSMAIAQAPPPTPLAPLDPPPAPTANPQSDAKIALGSALFWDEQLSRTGTVACGTCHRPLAAGGDPRNDAVTSANPGANGQFGDEDDVIGSPGVPQHLASGDYLASDAFALSPQVGGRNAPSAINAGYSDSLFWDGRAGSAFSDPDSAVLLIASGGALENQALGPVVNSAEMAHLDTLLGDVIDRIADAQPLALASFVPDALGQWMADRSYAALFEEAFGSPGISAARMAMAIASYERSLFSDQSPLDAELRGTPSLTNAERAGRTVFTDAGCLGCHGGALLSDHNFHFIGVRPANEDLGRFAETGNNGDRGSMRTPSLRNVELSAPYMHNGRFATLEDVIEFYDRGGDFDAPNKPPPIRPLNLSAQQKSNLAAFLRRPLTDPRVATESGPFERPTLYSESERVPQSSGNGRAGSAGLIPQIVALEPPLLGSDNFTIGITGGLANAAAVLVIDDNDPDIVDTIPTNGSLTPLATTLDANGNASLQLTLPRSSRWAAQPLFGRVYISDPQADGGLAISALMQFQPFDLASVIMRDGFD